MRQSAPSGHSALTLRSRAEPFSSRWTGTQARRRTLSSAPHRAPAIAGGRTSPTRRSVTPTKSITSARRATSKSRAASRNIPPRSSPSGPCGRSRRCATIICMAGARCVFTRLAHRKCSALPGRPQSARSSYSVSKAAATGKVGTAWWLHARCVESVSQNGPRGEFCWLNTLFQLFR
jgi:hypothetical protein